MNFVAGFIVDILMVSLLMATIAYCLLLNRKIKQLQDGKSELAQLLAQFDDSIQHASDSILALQSTGKRVGEAVQIRLSEGQKTLDELQFLIARGEKVANEIEAGVAISRQRDRIAPASKLDEMMAVEQVESLEEQIEEQVMEASKNKVVASLEHILEKVARQRISSDPALRGIRRHNETGTSTKLPSRAEQELLEKLSQRRTQGMA